MRLASCQIRAMPLTDAVAESDVRACPPDPLHQPAGNRGSSVCIEGETDRTQGSAARRCHGNSLADTRAHLRL